MLVIIPADLARKQLEHSILKTLDIPDITDIVDVWVIYMSTTSCNRWRVRMLDRIVFGVLFRRITNDMPVSLLIRVLRSPLV